MHQINHFFPAVAVWTWKSQGVVLLSCSLPSKHENATPNAMGRYVYWDRPEETAAWVIGVRFKIDSVFYGQQECQVWGAGTLYLLPIPLGWFLGGRWWSDLWFWRIFNATARKIKHCTGKSSSKSVWTSNRGLVLWDNMLSVSLMLMETEWKEDVEDRNITHRAERNWYVRKVDDHKGVTDCFWLLVWSSLQIARKKATPTLAIPVSDCGLPWYWPGWVPGISPKTKHDSYGSICQAWKWICVKGRKSFCFSIKGCPAVQLSAGQKGRSCTFWNSLSISVFQLIVW